MSTVVYSLGVVLHEDGSFTRESRTFPEVPANPDDGVGSRDVILDPDRDLWVRIFIPKYNLSCRKPLIVHFHGGGYVTLLTPADQTVHRFCERVANKVGAIVVSVNYRPAPENRLPAAYQDGYSVLQWIEEISKGNARDAWINENHVDFSRIFVMGESAGGNLAHHIALWSVRDRVGLRLAGQILTQPFFGGEMRTESEIRLCSGPVISTEVSDLSWSLCLPKGASRDHEFSNQALHLPGILESLGEFPKTLIFVGGLDLLHDRQVEYENILKEADVDVKLIEFENAVHGFCLLYPESIESGIFIQELASFCHN